jgi:hypothetical protein
MPTPNLSVSEAAASDGAPGNAVATCQVKPGHTMADRAASPPNSGLSHTLAVLLGLVVLATVMGAMLVAIADKLTLAIRVAQLQTLDLGSWLPLP